MEEPRTDETGLIVPETIRYGLERVPASSDDKLGGDPSVPNRESRLRANPKGAAWIEYQYEYDSSCGRFEWDEHWRQVPLDILLRVFSEQELIRMRFFSLIQSDLCEWVRENHFLIHKVENSLWHYGGSVRYNRLCDVLDSLGRLSFPGLKARIGHTSHFNEYGPCVQKRDTYLDGTMGLLLFDGSEHVLTADFSPGDGGIYVAQVQLRKKRGNRFLYRMRSHVLDAVLESLHSAFGDDLWLVRGGSAVAAIRRSYGKQPCTMSPEDEVRIAALYDRPPAGFVRTGEETVRQGRTYARIRRTD